MFLISKFPPFGCRASVDVETDKKIQNTIQTEFKDRTLICIARRFGKISPTHFNFNRNAIDRLRTILHYDRILVLDQGRIMVCHD